jgi:hypothetical protein
MSKIDDGGAAFPKSDCIEPDMEPIRYSDGMTLRDYFAAAALQAIVSNFQPQEVADIASGAIRLDGTPKAAYTIADAMIAARKEAQP